MPDFYDNQQDYIDKLNAMADAFHAGPFNAVPLAGGVAMTGPLTIPTLTVGAGGAFGITKNMVGLGNVDNTSDADKPLSTPQQNAIPVLVKANLTGYINATVLSSSRAVTAADIGTIIGVAGADYTVTLSVPESIGAKVGDKITFFAVKAGAAQASITLVAAPGSKLYGQAELASLVVLNGQQAEIIFVGTGNWQVGISTIITKTMVGLSNVDNTSDASKPVSTAQQAALNLKAPLANPPFTGLVTVDSAGATKLIFKNGAVRGGIGADATYCFRVSNASDTMYVLDVDNSGTAYLAGGLVTAGLRPNVDNTVPGGTAAFRFTALYAASGTINTSDATHKTVVNPLTEAELAAAEALALEIGTYKFLDALEAKGDSARLHVGVTVQRAIEVMEEHGLAPLTYGFICFDEWGASEGRAAGSIYSFRPDELNAFVSRGLAYRLAALDSRLAALEGSGV